MKLVRFLGEGLPARAIKCHRADCGATIAVGAEAFAPDSYSNWATQLHCSAACFAATFPEDPDVANLAAPAAEPLPSPAPPAAADPELW